MHPGLLLDGKRTVPPIFLEFSLDHKLVVLEDSIKIVWDPSMIGVIADTQDGNSSQFWAAWDRLGSHQHLTNHCRGANALSLLSTQRETTVQRMARQQSLWPCLHWQSGEVIATILPVRHTMPCKLHNLPLLLLYLCTQNYFLQVKNSLWDAKYFVWAGRNQYPTANIGRSIYNCFKISFFWPGPFFVQFSFLNLWGKTVIPIGPTHYWFPIETAVG